MELYNYQRLGAKFLCKNRSALLADEQGTGKTITAIAAINSLRAKKILIVCPASVRNVWLTELRNWLDMSWLKISVISQADFLIPQDSDIVISSYDILTYGGKYDKANSGDKDQRGKFTGSLIYDQIVKREWAVGIWDEAHYLKNRDSIRTQITLCRNGLASRCAYKWFLTGTPVLNRPSELYPVLRSCSPATIAPFLSYTGYTEHFCGGYWDGVQWWDKGATNCEELNRRLSADFMLRRTKQEVLSELPEKTFQTISLPQTGDTKKLVAEEFRWDEKSYGRIALALDSGELSSHRQELAIAKVPQAISWIAEVLESEKKIVIFAYHREVIRQLKIGLENYNPVILDGSTGMSARSDAVSDFQTDPMVRVFIGQITAAGVGITLTAASHVVFVEPDWVPGVIHQAVDRCHRIGQKSAVLAQFLVVEGSLEERMMNVLVDKTKIIKTIVETL